MPFFQFAIFGHTFLGLGGMVCITILMQKAETYLGFFYIYDFDAN